MHTDMHAGMAGYTIHYPGLHIHIAYTHRIAYTGMYIHMQMHNLHAYVNAYMLANMNACIHACLPYMHKCKGT